MKFSLNAESVHAQYDGEDKHIGHVVVVVLLFYLLHGFLLHWIWTCTHNCKMAVCIALCASRYGNPLFWSVLLNSCNFAPTFEILYTWCITRLGDVDISCGDPVEKLYYTGYLCVLCTVPYQWNQIQMLTTIHNVWWMFRSSHHKIIIITVIKSSNISIVVYTIVVSDFPSPLITRGKIPNYKHNRYR